MFDQEFYPTPISVIDKMLQPFLKSGRQSFDERFGDNPQILEPSAGKGDILDKITGVYWDEMYGQYRHGYGIVNQSNCYAIEHNPDLQAILRKKGYRVIDSDFLQHHPDYVYDIILMNPPFSNGEHHLLHAWNILENGSIACVLNAETVRNRFTKFREALGNIIDNFGSVEFIGQAFSQAERKTNAEIAIVWLHKKSVRNRFEFNFTPIQSEDIRFEDNVNISSEGVAVNDKIGAYLSIYDNTKLAFLEYLKARELVKFYGMHLIGSERRSLSDIISEADNAKDIKTKYNSFVSAFKEQAWIEILKKVNIEKYLTSQVLNDFDEWKRQQGGMDLNRQNILALMMSLVNGKDDIMKKSCVEVFDYMTRYYHENRLVVEGWKTNSMYKVNKKVIFPYAVERMYNGGFSLRYNYQRGGTDPHDIDKVMCWLSGKDYDKILKIEKVIRDKNNHKKGNSEFFEMTWYNKGTLHLKFREEELWARFNQIACDNKNWLGTT